MMTSPRGNYDVFTFVWSDVEYTPTQLKQLYNSRVPFLMMSTQGYLGRDEGVNAVAADEIYWLREIAKQPRMVVHTDQEVYYSIPMDHPQRVMPVTEDQAETEPMTFRELVDHERYTEFYFTQDDCDNDSKQSVFSGPDECGDIDFGKLTLHEPYDELYLVGHCIMDKYVNKYACIIPLYMPITLTIGVGLSNCEHEEFVQLMSDINTYVANIPKEVAYPKELMETSEILMYDGKPKAGEYTNLEPRTYVTLRNRQEKQGNKALHLSLFQANAEDEPSHQEHPKENQHSNVRDAAIHVGNTLQKQEAKAKAKKKKSGGKSVSSVLNETNRGGIRGYESNIGKLVKHGYKVSDRHPRDVIDELHQAFLTWTLPTEDDDLSTQF